MTMFYSHDFELFERNCMTRIISYTYEFKIQKNLSHKQSVLFYGPRTVSDILSHKKDPFEMISLFADCLSAQMFYFENMEENLRMKYFVNKSIHCHRLLEHVLRQNYTDDLKSYGKSKAKYNFEEARNEIKTRDSRPRSITVPLNNGPGQLWL